MRQVKNLKVFVSQGKILVPWKFCADERTIPDVNSKDALITFQLSQLYTKAGVTKYNHHLGTNLRHCAHAVMSVIHLKPLDYNTELQIVN